MEIFRHGDLCIRQIAKLPDGDTETVTSKILAYGEATGHHHLLTSAQAFAVMKGFDEKKYFELTATATLTHEEHKALSIPPGAYEIVMEREWDYFENDMRRVLD